MLGQRDAHVQHRHAVRPVRTEHAPLDDVGVAARRRVDPRKGEVVEAIAQHEGVITGQLVAGIDLHAQLIAGVTHRGCHRHAVERHLDDLRAQIMPLVLRRQRARDRRSIEVVGKERRDGLGDLGIQMAVALRQQRVGGVELAGDPAVGRALSGIEQVIQRQRRVDDGTHQEEHAHCGDQRPAAAQRPAQPRAAVRPQPCLRRQEPARQQRPQRRRARARVVDAIRGGRVGGSGVLHAGQSASRRAMGRMTAAAPTTSPAAAGKRPPRPS